MTNDVISRVIRDDVLDSKAYVVADASDMLKLDAMENPFPLPEQIAREWQERCAQCALNRYPDPAAQALRQRLRTVMDISADHEILIGNGSDELIQLLINACARDGATVMAPAPGFVMYRVLADAARQRFVELPLDRGFDLDAHQLTESIAREKPTLLFLTSPNNPSGNQLNAANMRRVISACPGLVVIDEAYFAFTDRHHGAWLDEFDNLLIMRTLSKLGLAGLRLGFLWGKPGWIRELDKLRLPYNISSLSQSAGELALQHFDLLQDQVRILCQERSALQTRLGALEWLEVFPSEANFVLVRVRRGDALGVDRALRSKNILVKCVHGSHPRLDNCLRITIGSPTENAALVAALQSYGTTLEP